MILLTGASGFLGKHLLAALLAERGAEGVTVMASAPIAGVATVLRKGDVVAGDAFREAPFNTITEVIHAGAFIPKSAAEGDDWVRCTANILHTQSLLQALPAGARRFINISTVDVYGPDENLISESSPVAPPSMYGLSKLYCEGMVRAWAAGSGAVIQNLRLGHIYGPGEEGFKKVIPESFKRVLRGERLQLWGGGLDERAFIYVEDAVHLILAALELTGYPGPINIAGRHALSMHDLMLKIQAVTEVKDAIEAQPRVTSYRSLSFDNAHMRRYLGDEQTTLEEGLRREWLHMKKLHEQNLL